MVLQRSGSFDLHILKQESLLEKFYRMKCDASYDYIE